MIYCCSRQPGTLAQHETRDFASSHNRSDRCRHTPPESIVLSGLPGDETTGSIPGPEWAPVPDLYEGSYASLSFRGSCLANNKNRHQNSRSRTARVNTSWDAGFDANNSSNRRATRPGTIQAAHQRCATRQKTACVTGLRVRKPQAQCQPRIDRSFVLRSRDEQAELKIRMQRPKMQVF